MSISLVSSHSLMTALALLPYFLIGFLIVKTVKKRSQIIRIFFVIYIMGVLEAVYGLFVLYSPHPSILFYEKIHGLDYVSGTFINRNHFAGYLEMIIPISIGLIFARVDLMSFSRMKWKEKLMRLSEKNVAISLLLLFSVILMSLALLFSRSRSATFLLVFIFMLFFLLAVWRIGQNKEQQRRMKVVLISVFIVILFLSLYIGMDATFKRFAMDRLLQESRLGIWANTLELFSSSPVFGTGLGTFAAMYPNVEGDGKLAKITHVHNDYLEYLTETGFIGFGLLVGGIFWIFWTSFKLWLRKRHPVMQGLGIGGLVAIVAILIHGITDFNFQIPSNMLLFSVILSLTLVTVTYKPSKRIK